ncbi:MAG: Trk system potassium transporter TrkA [Bacteroidales bacterium]
MNIIIAGDGEVGFHIAKLLSDEHHDITIVDPHRELLEMLEAQSDLMTITGDSTSISVLENAGAGEADLLISVLHDEKTNIVTSVLGKKLGVKRTICRVNNPEFLLPENKAMLKSLGVDSVISPESIAAREVIDLLNQTAATEVFEFSGGKLSLFLIKLESNAKVINKSLSQVAQEYPHLNFRAVAIHRQGRTIIPRGDDRFLVDDLAYVITKPEGIDQMIALSGKSKIDIKNVMIVGGGRIGRLAAISLEDDFNLKVIDISRERCEQLGAILTQTLVINGDARDMVLLEDEGIRSMDAFIAVTRDSETNILLCLMARKYGVRRTIALVENITFIDVAQNMGIDTIINKKLITASHIVRFTLDAQVTSIKCLNGVDADVLEFLVKQKSDVTNKKISDLKFPANAIIGGLVRNNEGHIAVGDLQIQPNDRVVVFSLPDAMSRVDKLFN